MIAIAITALFIIAGLASLATIMAASRNGIAAYRAIKAELARMDARLNWPREQLRPVNPSWTARRSGQQAVSRARLAAA